jgi:SSS family solute:Na+ symporter
MKRDIIITLIGVCTLSFYMTGCNSSSEGKQTYIISDSLKAQCIHVLKGVMRTESKWVKVHAAEYLIWTGHPNGVQDVFSREEQLHGVENPYRIGIWRVLIEAANNKKVKDQWADSVQSVFLNKNSKYRIWAAETMAKLDIVPAPGHPEVVQQAIDNYNTELSLYTLWAASNINADSLQHCKNKLLHLVASEQTNPSQERLSAYLLRHIDHLNANEWKMLAAKASAEPDTSLAKVYMLSAAYVTTPHNSVQSDIYERIRAKLTVEAKSPRAENRTELAAALAKKGTISDLPILTPMLNNEYPLKKGSDNADVRAAAAYAILMIGKR